MKIQHQHQNYNPKPRISTPKGGHTVCIIRTISISKKNVNSPQWNLSPMESHCGWKATEFFHTCFTYLRRVYRFFSLYQKFATYGRTRSPPPSCSVRTKRNEPYSHEFHYPGLSRSNVTTQTIRIEKSLLVERNRERERERERVLSTLVL